MRRVSFVVSLWTVASAGCLGGRSKAAVKDATFSVMVTARWTCSQVELRLRSWPNSTTEAAHTTRWRICRCTNVKGGVGRSRTARQLPSGKWIVCQWVVCRVRSPSCDTAQRTGLDLSSGDDGRVSGSWFKSNNRVQIVLCCPLNVKFILEQATKAQRGSTGIALLFP